MVSPVALIKQALAHILPVPARSFFKYINAVQNELNQVKIEINDEKARNNLRYDEITEQLNKIDVHEELLLLIGLHDKLVEDMMSRYEHLCNCMDASLISINEQLQLLKEGQSALASDLHFRTDHLDISLNEKFRVFRGDIRKLDEKFRVFREDIRNLNEKSRVFNENIRSLDEKSRAMNENVCSLIKGHDLLARTIEEKINAIQTGINNTQRITDMKIEYRYRQSLAREQYPEALRDWYFSIKHEFPDIENPVTYNEKIQWIKLHGITPLIVQLADKYLAREWVKDKIGEQHLIPLIGVWERFDDVDFTELPQQFVLKMNHGYAYNIIVKDKDLMDFYEVRRQIFQWQQQNFAFVGGFEMQYNGIPRRIIAEEYLENDDEEIYDYKFWCFDGKVNYIQFISERKDSRKMTFFNPMWEVQQFSTSNLYQRHEYPITKPENLQEMISLAETLAEPFAHVRVDLYRLNDGRIYFGEMTFTPASGLCSWDPPEYNRIMGEYFKLPNIKG